MQTQGHFTAQYSRGDDASRARFALIHGGGSARYIVLPKGHGKTDFLSRDMRRHSAEVQTKLTTVFIPLRRDESNPLGVINDALRRAIESAPEPLAKRAARLARTPVKGISIPGLGGGIEFADRGLPPQSPGSEGSVLQALAQGLLEQVGSEGHVILLFDDAQLLLRRSGKAAANALRAALEEGAPRLRALFALDSEPTARSLFHFPGAPLCGLARPLKMSPLGKRFFEEMTQAYQKQVGVNLDMQQMAVAWERLHCNAGDLRELLETMAEQRQSSPWDAYAEIFQQHQYSNDFSEAHQRLSPIRRRMVERIAAGLDPLNSEALKDYAEAGEKSRVRLAAADRELIGLVDDLHVVRDLNCWQIADSGYRCWLLQRLPTSIPPRALAESGRMAAADVAELAAP